MKFGVVSDLHLDASNCSVDTDNIDCLAIIGDLAESTNLVYDFLSKLAQKTNIPIIYVLGNHDYYYKDVETYHNKLKSLLSDYPNIHILQNETLIIDGYKFIGTTLWSGFNLPLTDFNVDKNQLISLSQTIVKNAPPGMAVKSATDICNSPSDLPEEEFNRYGIELIKFMCKFNIADFTAIKMNNYYITANQMISLHEQSVSFLKKELNNDDYVKVVLTHFPPVQDSIHKMYSGNIYNPYFCNHLPDLVTTADFWFHGHTHTCFNYKLKNTEIYCNPRGYSRLFNLSESAEYQNPLIVDLARPTLKLKLK